MPKYGEGANGARVRASGFDTFEVATYTEAQTLILKHNVGGSIRRVKAA